MPRLRKPASPFRYFNLPRSDEGARQRREAGGRTLGQQPGRKQTFAFPKKGASDAEVQANEDSTEVRQRARQEDVLPPFLADFVRHQRRAPATAPLSLQRTSRWGVYRARAFPQLHGASDGGPPTHAILLSRHLPRTIRIMRAVERFDLSPRERQAAFHLGMGADAATGAAALGVSVATWRSYVKRVYQRLDVNDRMDLMHRLQRVGLA